MKSIKIIVLVIALGFSLITSAQESEIPSDVKVDKTSYYQKRAEEDAKYEQQFSAKTKVEEEAFWNDQKAYEENLKQQDKKAYRAYMTGKRNAYINHYEHCDHHCHHSDYYHHHASFYYRYGGYYYERHPSRSTTIKTGVRVNTPSVRVGLF